MFSILKRFRPWKTKVEHLFKTLEQEIYHHEYRIAVFIMSTSNIMSIPWQIPRRDACIWENARRVYGQSHDLMMEIEQAIKPRFLECVKHVGITKRQQEREEIVRLFEQYRNVIYTEIVVDFERRFEEREPLNCQPYKSTHDWKKEGF